MSRTIKKQNISRLVACLLSVIMLVSLLPAANAAVTSGKCGDNLSWSFADNRLTITGSGKMTDYDLIEMAPWYDYRDQIHYLSLPDGMTSVGQLAFYDCTKLSAVTLPASVTAIGDMAFAQCSGIQILNLSAALKTIGSSAFELCTGIRDFRLPDSLESIGTKAFYRCSSLLYVTVPVFVTELGDSAFAYCTSLISARINAPLASLPVRTFYGCESLSSVVLPETTKEVDDEAFARCNQMTTVYYPGTQEDAEELRESIGATNKGFDHNGSVSDEIPAPTETSTNLSTKEDGNIVIDKTTVTVTDGATVSTTVTDSVDDSGVSASVEVNATIVTDSGWSDVTAAVDQAVQIVQEKTEQGAKVDTIKVNGYVTNGEEVPKEILDKISDAGISLNIQTESGARFEVEGNTIKDQEIPETLCLSYTISTLKAGAYEGLNGTLNYGLRFDASSAVKTEVLIRLPFECGRQTASIYQIESNKAVLLQSVVVDDEGYAHFYIAEINKDMQYAVGVNVPGIDKSTLIIPEELYGEYGVTGLSQPIEYVITGRTSSWGMDAGTVTLILVAVLVVCVAGVGVFMYTMNKRKLKMGYVPDLDDEEDEDDEN